MEVSEANGGAAACERAKIFVGYRRAGMSSPHGRHVASKLQEEVSEGTAEVRKRTRIGQGAPASQRR